MKFISTTILLATGLLIGCSSANEERELEDAETLSEVIEIVTGDRPSNAYALESTSYMAVIFETTSAFRDGHLLDVKRATPVLLDRYPDIDRLYFAWEQPDVGQYMKVQLERDLAAQANWETLRVEDIEGLSSMYWMVPELR